MEFVYSLHSEIYQKIKEYIDTASATTSLEEIVTHLGQVFAKFVRLTPVNDSLVRERASMLQFLLCEIIQLLRQMLWSQYMDSIAAITYRPFRPYNNVLTLILLANYGSM